MGLEKLTIKVEDVKSSTSENLKFGESFKVLFNPEKLVFSKSANWSPAKPKHKNRHGLQFDSASPRTLKLDLIFDTFDPDDPNMKDEDVRKAYTDNFLHLIMVDDSLKPKRPPVCRLSWGGEATVFFQGVLQQLEQQFTLFTENGTPVRAKLSCTFMEWWIDYKILNDQAGQLSDVVKTHIVKSGETLSSIAAAKCLDPKSWKTIANANGIDDPRALTPGTLLLVPAQSGRS
jgi:nucleoid-associated protein YgaU